MMEVTLEQAYQAALNKIGQLSVENELLRTALKEQESTPDEQKSDL